MKKLLMALALLLLAAVPAVSQTVREEGGGVGAGDFGTGSRPGAIQPLWVGGRTDDSVSTALRFDSDGNLKVVTSNAPQTWYFQLPSIITNTFRMGITGNGSSIANSADSSAVIETLGANNLYLNITAGPDTAVGCATLWAIQIRRHNENSSDSLNAFINLDMNGNGAQVANNNGTTGGANDLYATSPTDTIGSLNYSLMGGALALTALRAGERLLALPNTSHAPRKQYSIHLTSQNGAPITARYLSIRVRLLAIYANTACTALTAGQGTASFRADLTGTR